MTAIEPGAVFGRWTVAGRSGRRVQCVCECGSTREVDRYTLIGGRSSSCGCLQREQLASSKRTHGMCDTPTYSSWCSMITRCTNPKHRSFHNYGGRGIVVCERWKTFDLFLADMGEKPGKGWSVERLDNNLGYEPGNCVWATARDQAANTRRTRLSPEVVRAVRAGEMSTKQARALTGASRSAVACARRGETWKGL